LPKKLYCHVCGSEVPTGKQKNRKTKHKEKKKTNFGKFFRRKGTIITLTFAVFVLIVVPAIVIPFAQRAQYQGILHLQSVNIIPYDQYEDNLEIVMRVSQGRVSIDRIHLYSVDRVIRYQTMNLHMEYERYDYFVETFIIHKELPPLNDGIVLHIEFKYKEQWILYLF